MKNKLILKKVGIEYSITNERAVYKITDQGTGFDYHEIVKNHKEKNNKIYDVEPLSLHGRGVLMCLNIFDEMTFNDAGNEITGMIKF